MQYSGESTRRFSHATSRLGRGDEFRVYFLVLNLNGCWDLNPGFHHTYLLMKLFLGQACKRKRCNRNEGGGQRATPRNNERQLSTPRGRAEQVG
jgi:hypothetical protein